MSPATRKQAKAFGRPQNPLERREASPQRHRLLLFVLALALLHGILYLAVMPPWQHYDEPTHFEYVRLIAERWRLPQAGEYDLEMRRQIALSMKAADFWKGREAPAIDLQSSAPPDIGISELEHPPLYYALLAVPQLLVHEQAVETQLYLARLCSVLLSLVVIASAYSATAEAFPRRQWLPLATAGFVALLPPYVDLMSSVNNDVGAAAVSALVLWAGVRCIRRGISWRRAIWLLFLVVLSCGVKSTAGIMAVVALAVVAISCLPARYRLLPWAGAALLTAAVLVLGLDWEGYAAHWYSLDPFSSANRVEAEQARALPEGRRALSLQAGGREHPRAVFQEVELRAGRGLKGQVVSLGAWFRAAEGAGGYAALNVDDGVSNHWNRIMVTPEWQFHAFTTTVSLEAKGVSAQVLLAAKDPVELAYVDGVVLAVGAMPVGIAPSFDSVGARAGRWGTATFTNLLANGSAEESWPGLRADVGKRWVRGQHLSLAWLSVLDWRRTWWAYVGAAGVLFRSFWGGFGWNHLSLPSAFFLPLAILTSVACLGAILRSVPGRHREASGAGQGQRLILLFGAVLLASWGSALVRVHPVFTTGNQYWPVARYAYVGIVPTAALLCAGLGSFIPGRWRRVAAWVGLAGLLFLDGVALLAVILPYYY